MAGNAGLAGDGEKRGPKGQRRVWNVGAHTCCEGQNPTQRVSGWAVLSREAASSPSSTWEQSQRQPQARPCTDAGVSSLPQPEQRCSAHWTKEVDSRVWVTCAQQLSEPKRGRHLAPHGPGSECSPESSSAPSHVHTLQAQATSLGNKNPKGRALRLALINEG